MKNRSEGQYLDIFYYFSILKKYKKSILSFMIIGLLIGVIIAARTPQLYYARVSILLASGDGGGGGLSLSFSNRGIPLLSSGGGGAALDMITALLQSARMRKAINGEFKLSEKPPIGLFLKSYEVSGCIIIEAVSEDPVLSVEIANFAVRHLDAINEEMQISTQRPFVKVLDPATNSCPIPRNVQLKIYSILFIFFIIGYSFVFLYENRKKIIHIN